MILLSDMGARVPDLFDSGKGETLIVSTLFALVPITMKVRHSLIDERSFTVSQMQ
jgi:hypothetical protein